jgi:hypothetical protein
VTAEFTPIFACGTLVQTLDFQISETHNEVPLARNSAPKAKAKSDYTATGAHQ